ncbi:MAG: PTS sugar transporter subunit IIA [Candidatus Eisenbacteria bacterium]
MEILETVRRECVAAARTPGDKSSVLREIAALARRSELLSGATEEDIRRGLEEREAVGSTGFGKGIAIPHCRLASVERFVVGAVSIPNGVEFDSLDGGPVRLAAFIVGPASESTEHIQVLSALSRVLSNAEAVEELVRAGSDEALYESLVRHLTDEPRVEETEARSLFYVFVQDEDVFHDILQVFGGTEPRFTAVLDAAKATSYLWKVPLFAGLWRDTPESFCRVIVSVVSKKMTNEMIRRVEAVVGPLAEAKHVLVTVQETFFTAGSLTA